MRHWLRDHFIPHPGNGHHPRMLRWEVVVFLLAVVIAVEGAFLVSVFYLNPGSNLFSLILPSVLVQDANASRLDAGLGTLQNNTLLERAATLKAQDMASKGYFAHTSPEGVTPWYWLQKVGYDYTVAGENLAVNFIDSQDVHDAWMNSPSHRANIMNGGYTEVGIATATGMYKGDEVTFVVQYFGKPKTAPKIAVAPQQVKAATTQAPATVLPEVSVSALPALAQAETRSVTPLVTNVVSRPRYTTSKILMIIAGIIFLALLITAIARYELPHPRVAIAPMLLLLVIASILVLNQFLAGGLALS